MRLVLAFLCSVSACAMECNNEKGCERQLDSSALLQIRLQGALDEMTEVLGSESIHRTSFENEKVEGLDEVVAATSGGNGARTTAAKSFAKTSITAPEFGWWLANRGHCNLRLIKNASENVQAKQPPGKPNEKGLYECLARGSKTKGCGFVSFDLGRSQRCWLYEGTPGSWKGCHAGFPQNLEKRNQLGGNENWRTYLMAKMNYQYSGKGRTTQGGSLGDSRLCRGIAWNRFGWPKRTTLESPSKDACETKCTEDALCLAFQYDMHATGDEQCQLFANEHNKGVPGKAGQSCSRKWAVFPKRKPPPPPEYGRRRFHGTAAERAAEARKRIEEARERELRFLHRRRRSRVGYRRRRTRKFEPGRRRAPAKPPPKLPFPNRTGYEDLSILFGEGECVDIRDVGYDQLLAGSTHEPKTMKQAECEASCEKFSGCLGYMHGKFGDCKLAFPEGYLPPSAQTKGFESTDLTPMGDLTRILQKFGNGFDGDGPIADVCSLTVFGYDFPRKVDGGAGDLTTGELPAYNKIQACDRRATQSRTNVGVSNSTKGWRCFRRKAWGDRPAAPGSPQKFEWSEMKPGIRTEYFGLPEVTSSKDILPDLAKKKPALVQIQSHVRTPDFKQAEWKNASKWSDGGRQFAVRFSGGLRLNKTANYQFENRLFRSAPGFRIVIDGHEVTGNEWKIYLRHLTKGIHPIWIEYYKIKRPGESSEPLNLYDKTPNQECGGKGKGRCQADVVAPKDTTRESAQADCGPICSAIKDCDGFNFVESLGKCYFRKQFGYGRIHDGTYCYSHANPDRDCYRKKDLGKQAPNSDLNIWAPLKFMFPGHSMVEMEPEFLVHTVSAPPPPPEPHKHAAR